MARANSEQSEPIDRQSKKKSCAFCDAKNWPTYTDSVTLRRFMSGRGKIVPRQRSGICSKHQRILAREIKRARHLALLPFTLQV